MDNLNTHNPASLYKCYPAEEARCIMKRLEIHYTPKHANWLDINEKELNVMTRQCHNRRIAEIGLLRSELSAWKTHGIHRHRKLTCILEPGMPEQNLVPCIPYLLLPL